MPFFCSLLYCCALVLFAVCRALGSALFVLPFWYSLFICFLFSAFWQKNGMEFVLFLFMFLLAKHQNIVTFKFNIKYIRWVRGVNENLVGKRNQVKDKTIDMVKQIFAKPLSAFDENMNLLLLRKIHTEKYRYTTVNHDETDAVFKQENKDREIFHLPFRQFNSDPFWMRFLLPLSFIHRIARTASSEDRSTQYYSMSIDFKFSARTIDYIIINGIRSGNINLHRKCVSPPLCPSHPLSPRPKRWFVTSRRNGAASRNSCVRERLRAFRFNAPPPRNAVDGCSSRARSPTLTVWWVRQGGTTDGAIRAKCGLHQCFCFIILFFRHRRYSITNGTSISHTCA